MLSRRLQILIDEARYERLAKTAQDRGVSVALVIREAIDRSFPPHEERRARAAAEVLSAKPMMAPEPEELLKELDQLRTHRR